MSTLARTDNSILTRWWWTVDRWNLAAVVALAVTGAVMALAASPPVAARLGLDTYYFAGRQVLFLAFGLFVVVCVSLLSPKGVRRLAMATLAGSMVAMVAVLAVGLDKLRPRRLERSWSRLGGARLLS